MYLFWFSPGHPGGVPGLLKSKVMNEKLMKILAFLQKLQAEAIESKMYSFGISVLRQGKGMIVAYHYQKKENSRMNCKQICGSFYESDCRDLGCSLKDIRAFMRKA